MRTLHILLLYLAAALLVACGAGAAPPAPTPLPAAITDPRVIAEGKVVPAAFVELTFSGRDLVADILVAEGDQVRAGDALARLDSAELELRVRQAQAALDQATASYADLRLGATPEQIAAAEARIAQAQAGLTQAAGSVTGADLTAARARVEQARTRIARLQAGPKDTELARAQADLDQAQADLQSQRDALSLAKTGAERAVEQAANQLRAAQEAYAKIYWENREQEAKLDEYNLELPQEARDAEAAALRAVQDAEHNLEQARAAYEQARQAEITGIAAAQARVAAAQAGEDQLRAGADAEDLAAARAELAQAQAALARLLGPEHQGRLESAEAAVAAARAELAVITADPREPALAVAQARVQAAAADLAMARLMLSRATLTTPIAGTVAELNLKLGQRPPADRPAIIVADLSAWRIETADLTELSIVRIREGDPAEISFDAIDGFTLPGTVLQIKPIGQNRQGDIVYTVVVAPQRWDERIRWNMTTSVRF